MKQRIKQAVELFNSKPLKADWINFAIEANILQMKPPNECINLPASDIAEPSSIAEFLKTAPGLGKTQIGEYISKGPPELYPYHAQVLKEYVKTFHFAGTRSY